MEAFKKAKKIVGWLQSREVFIEVLRQLEMASMVSCAIWFASFIVTKPFFDPMTFKRQSVKVVMPMPPKICC